MHAIKEEKGQLSEERKLYVVDNLVSLIVKISEDSRWK